MRGQGQRVSRIGVKLPPEALEDVPLNGGGLDQVVTVMDQASSGGGQLEIGFVRVEGLASLKVMVFVPML